MPWKALPFVDRARKDALSAKFGVQGIPTLVLLDEHGNVITLDGRSALMSKPFPFT
jgi:nucleoredoxin